MDERAYHLQYAAHQAVAKALASRRLVRQPCEECGGAGQAHHDSYYPEAWLSVRWLCREHHRKWHREHEPVWPTIYEFHPSDNAAYWQVHPGKTLPNGPAKTGRIPRPWFRTGRGTWCVGFNGKHYNLGRDYEQAMRNFTELTGGTFGTFPGNLPVANPGILG